MELSDNKPTNKDNNSDVESLCDNCKNKSECNLNIMMCVNYLPIQQSDEDTKTKDS